MTPSALTAARFLFALGVAFAALAWYLRRPRFTDWYEPFAEPFGDA